LVFTIEIYYDARPYERQIPHYELFFKPSSVLLT